LFWVGIIIIIYFNPKGKNIIMQTKTKIIIFVLYITLAPLCFCSCGKKEPAAQPDPADIIKKISDKFAPGESLYDSETKKLTEQKAAELYSEDKNKPVDLSKIEKYAIIINNNNSEIGIFKLYGQKNAEYVKSMARTRSLKISCDAEVRSYGNYAYYVAHPQKDGIFKIIEDMLRGDKL